MGNCRGTAGPSEKLYRGEGDTLWDISGRFLKNPWAWPDVWQANPDIKNPDLIYPGDVLELVYVDGKPRLVRKGKARRAPASASSNRVKLVPKVRTDVAVPPIPIEAIKPFLTHPRVASTLKCCELLRTLSAFRMEIWWAGKACGLTLTTCTTTSALPNSTSFAVAEVTPIGIRAKTLDTSPVTWAPPPFHGAATRRRCTWTPPISRSCAVDRLVPARERAHPEYFFPSTPEKRVNGTILDAYESLGFVGIHQVVLLDRGRDDGLAPGDTLFVANRGRIIRDYWGPREEQRVIEDIGGAVRQSDLCRKFSCRTKAPGR